MALHTEGSRRVRGRRAVGSTMPMQAHVLDHAALALAAAELGERRELTPLTCCNAAVERPPDPNARMSGEAEA